MKIIRWIAVLILFSTAPLFAFNESFLRDSAMSKFTDQDRDAMMKNIYHALDVTPDNQKSSWNNPASGAWGYAMPSHTTTQNGMRCRQLLIYNNAHKIPGETSFKYCKINGEWKIVF